MCTLLGLFIGMTFNIFLGFRIASIIEEIHGRRVISLTLILHLQTHIKGTHVSDIELLKT